MNTIDDCTPFIKGIQNSLKKIEEQKNEGISDSALHFLNNMIQGQFIDFFSKLLCQYFEAKEITLEKTIMNSLSEIMSTELFQTYRQKVTEDPSLSIKLAEKIVKIEDFYKKKLPRKEKAYLSLFKKYFVSNKNIKEVIGYILSHYDIEKEILIYKFSKEIDAKEVILNLKRILEENKNPDILTLFKRYIYKNKQKRLSEMIMSGDWMIELSFFNNKKNTALLQS